MFCRDHDRYYETYCPLCVDQRGAKALGAAISIPSVFTGAPLPAAPQAAEQKQSALAQQEGGAHYKNKAIQPIEYIHANGLNFIEGSVVKYITRWREKGGVQDLKKIKHYIDLLIELEAKNAK